jgi:trimethylamine:corrinoid methyltransferase-like protein
VYQNFFAAGCVARALGNPDIPYPGMGTLDNGGVGSPTQLMLDMEIRKSQFALQEAVEVSEATLLLDEIDRHIATGETFLTSDHTLAHFRELWTSELFPLTVPEAAGPGSDEQRILDRCEARWRANLERWQPPDLPADKLRALEGVVERAGKELR